MCYPAVPLALMLVGLVCAVAVATPLLWARRVALVAFVRQTC